MLDNPTTNVPTPDLHLDDSPLTDRRQCSAQPGVPSQPSSPHPSLPMCPQSSPQCSPQTSPHLCLPSSPQLSPHDSPQLTSRNSPRYFPRPYETPELPCLELEESDEIFGHRSRYRNDPAQYHPEESHLSIPDPRVYTEDHLSEIEYSILLLQQRVANQVCPPSSPQSEFLSRFSATLQSVLETPRIEEKTQIIWQFLSTLDPGLLERANDDPGDYQQPLALSQEPYDYHAPSPPPIEQSASTSYSPLHLPPSR